MNKVYCQYSIVRFAPYVETGEFANVGIVMMAPKHRYFGFQLETRRYGRITRFFDELEPRLYKQTLRSLRDELDRKHVMLKNFGFDKRRKINDVDSAWQLFREILRPREVIIRYSEPRYILADDPQKKLIELFNFYVERNFVSKEYKESIIEKGIRNWLFDANVGERFLKRVIGDELYNATFPFVEQVDGRPVKVIKPLHLAQDHASKIIDHGAQWLFRVEELRRRHLMPENVMFTVAGPEAFSDTKRNAAFEEAIGRLENAEINVANFKDRERVVNFALNT